MTSAELKAAKAEFIAKVAKVISKYNSVSSKLSSINSVVNTTSDTLSLKAIVDQNGMISSRIASLIGQIESEKAYVVAMVDIEIRKLEALERRLEAEKKLKKSNTTDN